MVAITFNEDKSCENEVSRTIDAPQ